MLQRASHHHAIQDYRGNINFHNSLNFSAICNGKPPVANFVGTPTSGPASLTVSFTDLSSNSPTGWAWFFGDEKFTAPWTQVNASAGWSARAYHSSVAMPDGSIVLMGGWDNSGMSGMKNDMWRFMPAGSSLQSPSHTYTAAGIYSVALQASNSIGSNTTKKAGFITVLVPSNVRSKIVYYLGIDKGNRMIIWGDF